MSESALQLPNLRKPLSRTLPSSPSAQAAGVVQNPSDLSNPNHPDFIEDGKLGIRCGVLKRKIGRFLENLDKLLKSIQDAKSSPEAAKEMAHIGTPTPTSGGAPLFTRS